MCGGNVGLGGLGAVGADADTGGGIGAGASVAGFEICPPVSGGDPPAPFAGGKTCGEEDGNSSGKGRKPSVKSNPVYTSTVIRHSRLNISEFSEH